MRLPNLAFCSILVLSINVNAQKDNAASCDCFRTDSGSYFTYYRFFDYRSIDRSHTSNPDGGLSFEDTGKASVTSPFFSDTFWTADWNIQTWNNEDILNTTDTDATELMTYSNNNVYIESAPNEDPSYTTHLTLRTLRARSFQSAAEIDSVSQNYQFLSIRYLARIKGDAGACAGLFTWRCPGLCRTASSTDVEEADIEILTRGPKNRLQLTNQPSESPSGQTLLEATSNTTLPGASTWETWNEYRYDWTPGLSTWYVNGNAVANISFQAPKHPAQIILNIWGNGGSWTGNMSTGGAAYLQLQYIELAYNTSGPQAGSKMVRGLSQEATDSGILGHKDVLDEKPKILGTGLLLPRAQIGCKVVCSIDGVKGPKGTPVAISMAELGKEAWSVTLIVSLATMGYTFIA